MDVYFYFDVVCPYAYLASTRLPKTCEAAGARLHWRPILLGGLVRSVQDPSHPPAPVPPARVQHSPIDIERWARWWQVPLHRPAAHPRRTVDAMRLVTAAGARAAEVAHILYRAYWVEGRDVADRDELGKIAAACGLDVAEIDNPAIKEQLRATTDEAARAGAFGVPTMVVDNGAGQRELFWGQDRLLFVEQRLGIPREQRCAPDPLRLAAPAPAKAGGREVKFFYDFSSPFSYLAATQIERIANACGATLVWRPFLLGGLFKEIGNAIVPIAAMSEARRRYQGQDLLVWAEHWGVPLRWPSRFPMNTIMALRMVIAAPPAQQAALTHALYRAYWADDRDLNDRATLEQIATSVGLDGSSLVAQTSEPQIKQTLIAHTSEAVQRGIFGAPTCLVGDQLFFGQDRLHFVAQALLA